uniref:Uncharacterized protein n=1 Tax=Venturia canescens TaxID=32260 RepID=A0A0U1ZIX5_9HYME|nr:hypothetical protein [Venturia canescens]
MSIATSKKPATTKTLFTNHSHLVRYVYARPFTTDVENETKQMTTDGLKYFDVFITGVPDGVSPIANVAMIETGTPNRLSIFSNQELDEGSLQTLDSFYAKKHYPMLEPTKSCGNVDTVPVHNFYTVNDSDNGGEGIDGEASPTFVEYRYVQQRRRPTNMYYDPDSGEMFRLVLPEDSSLLVLIMPENFVRTGRKTGYFKFEGDLIVRVYSKHLLSAKLEDEDLDHVSVISTENTQLMDIVKIFFSRMGMHRIHTPSLNQVVSFDEYITLVVGSIANLNL